MLSLSTSSLLPSLTLLSLHLVRVPFPKYLPISSQRHMAKSILTLSLIACHAALIFGINFLQYSHLFHPDQHLKCKLKFTSVYPLFAENQQVRIENSRLFRRGVYRRKYALKQPFLAG